MIANAAFFQNAQIFVLQCFFFVMLLLIENVFPHGLKTRRTHAEKSVAILPVKVCNANVFMNLDESFLRISMTLAVGNFFVRLQRT